MLKVRVLAIFFWMHLFREINFAFSTIGLGHGARVMRDEDENYKPYSQSRGPNSNSPRTSPDPKPAKEHVQPGNSRDGGSQSGSERPAENAGSSTPIP